MRRTGAEPRALLEKLDDTDPEVAAVKARLKRGIEEVTDRPPVPISSALVTGADTGTPYGNFVLSASLQSFWSLYGKKATEEQRGASLQGSMTACLVSVVASILTLAVATVLLLRYLSPKKDELLIHGPFGTVLGSVMSCKGRLVYAFRGVPFAQPPVGELRFRDAITTANIGASSLYDGTRSPAACLQDGNAIKNRASAERENFGSDSRQEREDCLTLSIWKPPGGCESGPRAVLFVVHGHFFQLSHAENEGRCLAALGEVVVVVPQYRLGAMGFLNAPPDAPGNMGLMDLVLALNWTRTYAPYFCGDAENVVALGHNAGASSVGYLLHEREVFSVSRAILINETPFTRYYM
ncbi:hypothetical protein HPB51_024853 [Rhipicephalus microplus]|uniref:Carboxylesterase type B domain-containing protein n=1 Tax=Rhipicephalus microplus TaxID=6941 RepID=A0A9J6F9W5_RHIMP|nr:hypothetical protein HPB51_024853 [Rhipicephalus microplus]